MKCVQCAENGAENCPEFEKFMCDDCYTIERVTVMHQHDLKDLFDVDDFLSKKGGLNK